MFEVVPRLRVDYRHGAGDIRRISTEHCARHSKGPRTKCWLLGLHHFRDLPGPLTDVLDEVAFIDDPQPRMQLGVGLGKVGVLLVDFPSVGSGLVEMLLTIASPGLVCRQDQHQRRLWLGLTEMQATFQRLALSGQ